MCKLNVLKSHELNVLDLLILTDDLYIYNMKGSGCIYLIKCIENGKGYIGQYAKPSPTSRWTRHMRDAEKGVNYMLHQAIRKYGVNKFTIETLCICPKESLGNMESYYAEQFETYCWDTPGGYNMVYCGNQPRLNIKNTPEMNSKISKANKGHTKSPETCSKISEAKKGKKFTPEQLEAHHKVHKGKKHSEETIEKLRIASTGRIHTQETIEQMKLYSNSQERKEVVSNRFKGKPKSAEQKQKMSESASALWAKRKENQEVKPTKVYRCEACSHNFASKSRLNRHNTTAKHIANMTM